MERGTTHYKAKKIFFFFCLSLLGSNPVKATENGIGSYKDHRFKGCGSLTPSEETLPSSDNDLEGFTKNDEVFLLETGQNQAKKLAEAIKMDLDDYNKVRCFFRKENNFYRNFYRVLLTLWIKARDENQYQEFDKELSVDKLNHVEKVNNDRMYDIIIKYLELENVPDNYKRKLKRRVRESDIFPKHFCDSCRSMTKRGACILSGCACGVGTPLICCLWCWSPLAVFFYVMGSYASTGISHLICFKQENTRMRLARLCVGRLTESKCHQKMALVGLGVPECLGEYCF